MDDVQDGACVGAAVCHCDLSLCLVVVVFFENVLSVLSVLSVLD